MEPVPNIREPDCSEADGVTIWCSDLLKTLTGVRSGFFVDLAEGAALVSIGTHDEMPILSKRTGRRLQREFETLLEQLGITSSIEVEAMAHRPRWCAIASRVSCSTISQVWPNSPGLLPWAPRAT